MRGSKQGQCADYLTANVAGHFLSIILLSSVVDVVSAQSWSVYQATLAETNQKTSEVTTDDVRRIIADGSAILLDTRTRAEYVAGHLPGAFNIDAPLSAVTAAVDLLTDSDRAKPLVLYCNGPFCQASRRVAEQLVSAGYTNVKRYQLGIPIWRALGGPTALELEGITRIYGVDQTAVYVDVRSSEEFARGSLPQARSAPADQFVPGQPPKIQLPEDDFNTRIIIFGRNGSQARMLAESLSQRPWHNVMYFTGLYETLRAAIKESQR